MVAATWLRVMMIFLPLPGCSLHILSSYIGLSGHLHSLLFISLVHGNTIPHLAQIYTHTMTIQVVENSYPRRGDRMQEEPSAKNAQGLFSPDACIFVGKQVSNSTR